MMLHCGYLLGIVAAVVCIQSANADTSCHERDSSHLNPRDFYKQILSIGKTDHIAWFIHKLESSEYGDKPLVKKVLYIIENNAKSSYFKDQWEAILRASWITGGILGEVNTEKMCVIANMLNIGVEAENSLCDKDQWSCSFDEFQYSVLDALYSITRLVLSEQGCPTTGVPEIPPPDCFKLDKCIDEGRTYHIDEYWEEYDGSLAEKQKSGVDVNDCPMLKTVAKKLYKSDDVIENYLGGILTATAMAADWSWKGDIMQSDAMYDAIKGQGIFQEAVSSVKQCPCEQLQDSLLNKVEHYAGTLTVIFDIFKENLAKMEMGHVSKWTNDDHSCTKNN